MNKKLLVVSLIALFIFAFSTFPVKKDEAKSFHTPDELSFFQNQVLSPIGPGQYYLTSVSCRGCHGFDTLMLANVDENGMDVNLFDRWESTMMAQSAKDPFWRAKVSHEILVNPAHSNELQNKCTSCHAPMGHYDSFYNGNLYYGLSNLANDSLGLDGVSCAGCHTIDSSAGQTFSGIIPYDTTRHIYGPFTNPFAGPMQLYEGYTPVFSSHMDQSAVCASCHTLIAPTVDTSGNYTGGEFIEQATYHEYLNSSFPSNNVKCQTCHMPQLDDPIVIANGFISLSPRTPFNQHVFAGSNYFMLNLIKNNKISLDIDVDDSHFDSTLAATTVMLREKSVNLNLQFDSLANDTGYFKVRLENKAGHKFPSGYPSRRVVVQFIVTDANNDTVFKSGTFTNQFRVEGETPSFEPHHDILNQQNIPQIYEMVMGDVNYQFTSVLERAAYTLKDNRIPPPGFTTTASMYDTVKISNDAIADPDFNKINTVEGTGIDYVHYHIPLTGISGTIKVMTNIYFQVIPPKWLDEMFTYSSAEIDTFNSMFQNADQTPFLVAADSLTINSVGLIENLSNAKNDIKVWPTISFDGKVNITSGGNNYVHSVEVYSSEGKRVAEIKAFSDQNNITINLPGISGIYYLGIKLTNGTVYKKIIKQ